MKYVQMIVVGLIVGAIAAFLYRGNQHLGWIGMIGVGVAGSFVGGFIGSMFDGKEGAQFKPAGFLMSIVGSLVLIFVLRLLHIL